MTIISLIAFVFTRNLIFFTILITASIMILYSVQIFFNAKRKYFSLLKACKVFDYELTYSPAGLHYKMPEAENKLNWSCFKYYEQNNDAIYLYSSLDNSLIDIISKGQCGEKNYLEIVDLIKANVLEKTSVNKG